MKKGKKTISLTSARLEVKRIKLEGKHTQEKHQAEVEFGELKAAATLQNITKREETASVCTHRKGGFIRTPLDSEKIKEEFLCGTDRNYAVIKHRLPNGGMMVICQRCNKEWHPANPMTGELATPGWAEAVAFPTDNSPSGSTIFLAGPDLVKALQRTIAEKNNQIAFWTTRANRSLWTHFAEETESLFKGLVSKLHHVVINDKE